MSGDAVTPIGSKDEFIEASLRATQAPWTCTARDFRILESTHPHIAATARRKAAEWQATQAAEAQRRAAAPAHPTHRAAALPPVAAPTLADGEDADTWWKRHAAHLAPVWLVDVVYSHLQKYAAALREKNTARDERLDMLERRLTELEQRPAVAYKGVWSAAETYPLGALTTHHGSIWHSNVYANRAVPGEHPHWTLAVKKGRDAKEPPR